MLKFFAQGTILAGDAVIDELPHAFIPVAVIRGIDGKLSLLRGDRNRIANLVELLLTRFQQETEASFSAGQHQPGLRPVNQESGGFLNITRILPQ